MQQRQQAIEAFRQGRLKEAAVLCQAVLGSAADDWDTLHLLAMTRARLGDHAGALACLDRIVAIHPDHPIILGNRALALAELGRVDEAIAALDRVMALRPDDPVTAMNRGRMHQQRGHWQAALADYQRVLVLRPGDWGALVSAGNALLMLRRVEEALAAFDQALLARPEHVETLVDRGNALIYLDRPNEALLAYDQALALAPANAHAWDHRGNALRQLGRVHEALAAHAHAAQLAPDDADIRTHLGMCRLLLGDFKRGWADYESRPSSQRGDVPLWSGQENLAGKTILLHAEQGLGDTIQFYRYIPFLEALGARVVLEVPSSLRRLLGRDTPQPAPDYHGRLMSLPLVFGIIPAAPPYISATPLLPPGPRRIGLAWSGNPNHANDRYRSIPLAALAPLLTVEAEFYCLQTDIRPADQAVLGPVHVPPLADFVDTAALIASLDLVITVDTAVAHLAGAMGAKTWILLPFDPDWRWLLGCSDSPWYPTATLFRQPARGDWDSVVAAVARELGQFSN